VFSTIAPPWFTSATHGFRVIDLAEMLCDLMADRIPAISHTEELIVATARSIAGHTLGMEAFMPRIPIVGLACSTFLILPSSSAVPQEPARAGAGAESGQLIFNNACRTCHTTKEGDNRLGPNLHNIIGRKVGSLPNFGYSSAMKGADFVWDTGKLDSFIAKPDEVVPGNNMKPYGGLASAEDRTKLIAFLQSPTTD
jgi:cytochrome c